VNVLKLSGESILSSDMSEIRRSPLDRIRYYSEDEVLVLPSREGVLTGVFKYDYKTDVNRVGRYKRVEVIPTK
jgi:hypothetical protein